MCDPVSLTVAGLAVASTATTYVGQRQEGKDAAKAGAKRYSETARIAMDNYVSQNNQIYSQLDQQRQAKVQQSGQLSKDALAEQSSAAVAAGERGITGNSVSDLLSSFGQAEAANQFALDTNLDWQRRQSEQDQRSLLASTKINIASATPSPTRLPSALAAGLQIGSSVVGGIDSHQFRTGTGIYNPNNGKSKDKE